jgi:hypothetical protein
MGCITSRKEWPPKPSEKPLFRIEKKMVLKGGRWVSMLVKTTT